MEGYEKIVLWCDGLRTLKRKRREIPQTDEDDSDDESRASLKEQKRQDKEQSMVVCLVQCNSAYGVKWWLVKYVHVMYTFQGDNGYLGDPCLVSHYQFLQTRQCTSKSTFQIHSLGVIFLVDSFLKPNNPPPQINSVWLGHLVEFENCAPKTCSLMCKTYPDKQLENRCILNVVHSNDVMHSPSARALRNLECYYIILVQVH